MKKKINRINILILSVTMIVVSVISGFINYSYRKNDELKWLKNNLLYMAEISRDKDDFSVYNNIKKINSNIRITVVDMNGNVVFDTDNDISKMENHKDRKEIFEAFNGNLGYEERSSKSLSRDTIYYSIKTVNNEILRFSMDIFSFYSIFIEILYWNVLIVFVAILISIYINKKVVKELFEPITFYGEHLDEILINGHEYNVNIYDELLPFVRYLKNQQKDIKRYLEDIKNNNEFINNIITNMEEGFLVTDENGKIIVYNKSLVKLLNLDENINYKSLPLEFAIEDEENYDNIFEIIKSKKSKSIDFEIDNRFLKLYISTDDNNMSIIMVVDITDTKLASEMRREFTANISHELKSPLTSIMGYSEMIKNNLVKMEDVSKFSNIIFEKSKTLLKIIDDIIKLSRLDEEKVDKKVETFNLSELILSVEKTFEIEIKNRNIVLENNFDEKFIVNKNKKFLETVLENIISNSIKYNKQDGKISISLKKSYGEYDFIIEVFDSGIGIKKSDLNRIFERFYMVDKSRTQVNSTGLGLSIVRSLMNTFNSKIEIDSEFDSYTKVILKIK